MIFYSCLFLGLNKNKKWNVFIFQPSWYLLSSLSWIGQADFVYPKCRSRQGLYHNHNQRSNRLHQTTRLQLCVIRSIVSMTLYTSSWFCGWSIPVKRGYSRRRQDVRFAKTRYLNVYVRRTVVYIVRWSVKYGPVFSNTAVKNRIDPFQRIVITGWISWIQSDSYEESCW